MTIHDLLCIARDTILLYDDVARAALADAMLEHGMPRVQASAVRDGCPVVKRVLWEWERARRDIELLEGAGDEYVEAADNAVGAQAAAICVAQGASRIARWAKQREALRRLFFREGT